MPVVAVREILRSIEVKLLIEDILRGGIGLGWGLHRSLAESFPMSYQLDALPTTCLNGSVSTIRIILAQENK